MIWIKIKMNALDPALVNNVFTYFIGVFTLYL